MSKQHMPTVVSVMTPFPYFISPSASLREAKHMMDQHQIHHLPVLDDTDIIGMISWRDLLRAVSLGERLSDQTDILVSDLVNHRPYMVDVSDPLVPVLQAMVEKRLGSVIVLKDGELVGIFTSRDAMRYFAEFLEEAYPANPGDDDVA
ncbi:MAG TPA: CBS domain-containing protein [Pseudomonadales bacterium]|nr:CBS domain-containing protein [Pseudomonadales bacterium]